MFRPFSAIFREVLDKEKRSTGYYVRDVQLQNLKTEDKIAQKLLKSIVEFVCKYTIISII
jgi:hypothetical protein